MKILAIETSCDETAIAILEATGTLQNPEFKILGNSLISQIDLHQEFGGVVPHLAKREHQKNLPIILKKALGEAGISENLEGIDFIAVTSGPGLEPALWTGILFAEELGEKYGKPVLPINHMEGHIYSAIFNVKESLSFPALTLLVSGGHTEIVHIENFGKYEILGKTRDDAVGEAFDKVARLLGLPYPGGPEISRLAEAHRQKGLTPSMILPRPMIHSKDFDFSYSGLKTSVLYLLKGQEITEHLREEVAHAFEDAAIEVLLEKTGKALEARGAKTLIVAGGVANNTYLRKEVTKLAETFQGLTLLLPEKSLTTDNAVMIGVTAYIRVLEDPLSLEGVGKIKARGNLSL
ncbi:MAG: tRNA (adenosine(37)-N6)-threonylcarbamoyltransferase complex transferase subunit TsaD [Patescibacteria group bacterium]